MTNNKILAVRRSDLEMVEPGVYYTDAPAIGIEAGDAFPRMIAVPSRDGGEVLFRFTGMDVVGGEILSANYIQHVPFGSAFLTVWND